MARTARPEARGGRRRARIVALVVAFVVVDVVLVGLALGDRGEGRSQLAGPSTPPSSATPTPTATAVPVAPSPAPVPTRLLASFDELTAYRVQVADCTSENAVLERTDDGGATWSSSTVVGDAGLSSVLSLVVVDAAHVDMVGLAPGTCAPTATATYTSGLAFRDYPAILAASWFRSPTGPALVRSPATGGVVSVPCSSVITLVAVGAAQADALCSTGDAHRTTDGWATWTLLDTIPGAVSAAASGQDLYVAATGVPDCEGVSVSRVSAPDDAAPTSTAAVPVGCAVLPGAPVAGEVVISADEDALWLWSSEVVQRSTDGGMTWG